MIERIITALKTAATKMPVTRAGVKEHSRISTDADDDYLDLLIAGATAHVEQLTARRLITQTWYYYMQRWPSGNSFELPFGQLQSVTSIKYIESDNTTSTWTSGEYIVDSDSDPGRIVLDYGETWPSATLLPNNPIYTEYVCGYGDDKVDVPMNLRVAILMLIGHWYEHREAYQFLQGGGMVEMPIGFNALIEPFRIHRFGL